MPRIRASSIAEHKKAVRTAIITAASALFYERGYVPTTLGDVAEAAGVARSTIYDYFEDKQHLLLAVVADGVPSRLREVLDQLPADSSGIGWFEDLFERILEAAGDHRDLAKVVVQDAPKLSDSGRASMRDLVAPFSAAVEAKLVEAAEDGSIAAGDPNATAEYVAMLLSGALRRALTDRQNWSPSSDTAWRPLLTGALRGQFESA